MLSIMMQATLWKFLTRGLLKYSSVIDHFSDMVVWNQKTKRNCNCYIRERSETILTDDI